VKKRTDLASTSFSFPCYAHNSACLWQAIWPLEFEKFENKSDAIGTSGIDDRITKMIKNWYCSGETILVGKSEVVNIKWLLKQNWSA